MILLSVLAEILTARRYRRNTTPYEIQEFQRTPGIYFNKIGHLHQVRTTWKTVIQLDTTTITTRCKQVQKYLNETQNTCKMASINMFTRIMCENLSELSKKSLNQIKERNNVINNIYTTTTDKRRGLIDGIGSIAKSLFGTMDANDEKIINEQLTLLGKNQETLRHAVTHQLGILNKTIGQIDTVEKTLTENTHLMWNSINQIEEAKKLTLTRELITEHFTIVNAIIADITRDQEDILTYLIGISNGFLPPQLTPVKEILAQLEGAAAHLPQSAHFPFALTPNNWLQIEKFITVSAYNKNGIIFTILTLPLVTYPTYEIIEVIPLPTHKRDNIFSITEVTHTKIAINIESHTYLTLDDDELDKCIKIENHYTCTQNHPVYRINNNNTPCEILMYTTAKTSPICPIKNAIITHTIILTLEKSNTWLFSTSKEQPVRIKCKNNKEYESKIEKIGSIQSLEQCTFVIDDITLEAQGFVENKVIQIYTPNFNLTFPNENETIKSRDKEITEIKLKRILKKPAELTNLGSELATVKKELERDYQNPLVTHEHLVYTSIPSAIILIIVLVLAIYIIRKLRNKNNTPPIILPPKDIEQEARVQPRLLPRIPLRANRQSERY